MDRGVWQATVHGIAESQTLLRVHACMHTRDVKLGVVDLRCFLILYAALIAYKKKPPFCCILQALICLSIFVCLKLFSFLLISSWLFMKV